MPTQPSLTYRIAQSVITLVFLVNVSCAILFIFQPSTYLSAYELQGIGGLAAIQGIGITFLMWNATYPALIIQPKCSWLFGIVIAQQIIGLVGETIIFVTTASPTVMLSQSILRFIAFDAIGLVLLVIAWLLVRQHKSAADSKSVLG